MRSSSFSTAPTEEAVERIAGGEVVVVVDDPDRENEGDLVMAADLASQQAIAFMARHGRGLVCAALEEDRLRALGIPPILARGHDPLGTAFHVSVDHRDRASKGISAADRAATARALADPCSDAAGFERPGHLFPLGARPGGVLERRGHTEAAVDLARLAGRRPAGLICEIMADDGSMMRLPDLVGFARTHGLALTTISDLVAYRRRARAEGERRAYAAVRQRAGMVGGSTSLLRLFDRAAHGLH